MSIRFSACEDKQFFPLTIEMGGKIVSSVQFFNRPLKNRSLMKIIVITNELDKIHL